MRYLLLVLFLISLGGCVEKYELDILYQNGNKETVSIKAYNYPHLNDGCIYFDAGCQASRCGVRSFTYKEIE